MSSDSGRKLHHSGGAPPPEAEPLPCPRCESRNTKFCYYNNYNLSQPRHFCKGCRRYWTQGGALRNIPIGGGTRKNHAKRCRTSSASSTTSSVSTTATSSASQDHQQQQRQTPITATPISCITTTTEPDPLLPIDLNSVSGGFTSLLNTQNPSFLALGGFGLGIGSGYEDMGIDIGRGVWPLGEISGGESTHHHSVHGNGGGANGVSASLGGPTWQLGDGVFGEPDCFAWPDLSISPPCKEVK